MPAALKKSRCRLAALFGTLIMWLLIGSAGLPWSASHASPHSAELIQAGIRYYKAAQFDLARRYMLKASERTDLSPAEQLQLTRLSAYLALAGGNRREAKPYLEQVARAKKDAFLYYLLGNHALDNHRYKEAYQFYTRAILNFREQDRAQNKKHADPEAQKPDPVARRLLQNQLLYSLLPLGCRVEAGQIGKPLDLEMRAFSNRKLIHLMWQKNLSPEEFLMAYFIAARLQNLFLNQRPALPAPESVGHAELLKRANKSKLLDANTLQLLGNHQASSASKAMLKCRQALTMQRLPRRQNLSLASKHSPGKIWMLRFLILKFFYNPDTANRFALGDAHLKRRQPRASLHLMRPMVEDQLTALIKGQSVSVYELRQALYNLEQAYFLLGRDKDAHTLRTIHTGLFKDYKSSGYKLPDKLKHNQLKISGLDAAQTKALRQRSQENLHSPEALLVLLNLEQVKPAAERSSEKIDYYKTKRESRLAILEEFELPLAYPYYGRLTTRH